MQTNYNDYVVYSFEALQKLMLEKNLQQIKVTVELVPNDPLFTQTLTQEDVQKLIAMQNE